MQQSAAPRVQSAAPRAVARAQFPVERPSEPTEARATMPKIWTRKPEFEPTPREDDLATIAIPRQLALASLVKRLAIPMSALLLGGIAIGGMITFRGEGNKHHASKASSPLEVAVTAAKNEVTIEAPKPTPPPVVKVEPLPVAPPAPATPKLVAVRIESTPPGASATLLDNGNATPLGSTPVDATIDPTKSYDVVLALPGKTSKVEHLDPTASQHLAVAFDDAAPAPAPVAVVHKSHRAVAKKQAARVAVATAPRAAKAAKAAPAAPIKAAPTKVAAKAPSDPIARLAAAKTAAGSGANGAKDAKVALGTLSISTTPPCAILIDGQNSGLTSPQAAISLPAGPHSIRLIAAPQHVNKLVAVEVTPHHTTRLVQDFTK